jgi:hypothetical protein
VVLVEIEEILGREAGQRAAAPGHGAHDVALVDGMTVVEVDDTHGRRALKALTTCDTSKPLSKLFNEGRV